MKNEELSITSKATIAILVVVIVVTFSYMLFFSGSSTSQTQTTYAPDKIELHVQAQEFVKQGLKAPSTAKFPTLPYNTSTDGNGLYRVVSYVDSQNSFGATTRSDWSVTMRLTGDRWILEQMFLGNKKVYDVSTSN